MTNQLKILHLMHDEKFIDIFVDKFYRDGISNIIVILKESSNYSGKHTTIIQHVVPFSREYFNLSELMLKQNFVFVYNLDYHKAYLINRLKKIKNIKIIWNFFGTEIYNDSRYPFLQNLYGTHTKQLIRETSDINIKKTLRRIKYLLKGRKVPEKEIHFAMKKINFFAWYSKQEYNYLKNKVNDLPSFLQYPVDRSVPVLKPIQNPPNKLLIGNSRTPENNHLEILLLLEDVQFDGNVVIPFSYGTDLYYADGLKKYVKSLRLKIKLLENFLPYNEYLVETAYCNIAVYNSFRQMALGNIFISIANGAKVYLSEKNISFSWLKQLGFIIYSIEKDLKKDLEEKDFYLTQNLQVENQNLYYNITSPKNIDIFIKNLSDLAFDIN
ncbi:MAG: TDP-N-acetylfucosamine:lipid II N-acetylfucosaminyltransferase [Ginsengibacter sp.]